MIDPTKEEEDEIQRIIAEAIRRSGNNPTLVIWPKDGRVEKPQTLHEEGY